MMTAFNYSFGYELSDRLVKIKESNGITIEQTVSGVTTKYHVVDDNVTFETNRTDKIYYTYDSEDKLVSIELNGVEYYYVRNAQGDIQSRYYNPEWGRFINDPVNNEDPDGFYALPLLANPYVSVGTVIVAVALCASETYAKNRISTSYAKTKSKHGNSKSSTKPQHGYEIFNKKTKNVVKTGVSGGKLNKDGTSIRAKILEWE